MTGAATAAGAGRQGAPRGQWLTISIILVALAGIVVSLELVHVHFKVNTDPDFVSFCNMGEAVNCETVAASSWSEFLGVPIAVWAIFAYVVLFGLALAGTRRVSGDTSYKGFPGLIFLWSLAGAAVTIGMGYISTALIASFCLLCAGLYVLNTAVLVLAILLARRAAGGLGKAIAGDLRRMLRAPVTAAATLLVLVAVTVGLVLFYPDVQATVTETAAESPAAVVEDTCDQAGRTDEGYPLFGAPEGVVTIVEFSDYECGHCRKAHELVRTLVHEFHGKVRLVHRHFPLDNACNPRVPRPFHANACLAAKAAICADRQERFWDYNDRLFADQKRLEKKHIIQMARELGLNVPAFEACLLDPKTDAELRRDIRDGIGWDVRGTPSFVINGEFVKGARNEEGFRQLIQEALARCEQPAQPAAPPAPTTATP
jgi:protein-disulfide isomerase